ncbi:Uncharacterised protein [Bordetella ansorpii]|uniref:Uncharacterized protein n=1 Tax=Bordetella ansorpii TaxID=288768 RepID=A0A157RM03_9BORD|nr:hypothetical protein [Bordetella ansorpii]SAI59030.1 Uncharacterised protein [Bordetella ansorpii]
MSMLNRARAKRPNPQAQVDRWNAQVNVGDSVEYAEVIGDPVRTFKTKTPAEVLSGHTAVVWLEGKSGCVAILHCTPVTSPGAHHLTFEGAGDFEAFRKAEAWCRENDVAMGRMEGGLPIGLMWGADQHAISKWTNMTRAEQNALDGQLTGHKRYGPVTVCITARPTSPSTPGDSASTSSSSGSPPPNPPLEA